MVDAGKAPTSWPGTARRHAAIALTARVRRTGRRRSGSCRSIFHRLGVTENRHCPGRRRAPSRRPRLHATSPDARQRPMCVAASASLTAWDCPSSARAAASSTTALIWTQRMQQDKCRGRAWKETLWPVNVDSTAARIRGSGGSTSFSRMDAAYAKALGVSNAPTPKPTSSA